MMADSFLPAMRARVAMRLSEEGLSQGKIAGLLGVTQASVSLYMAERSQRRAAELLAGLGVAEEESSLYTSLLAEDLKKDPLFAANTLYSLWSGLLGRGSMCAPHRSIHPELAKCDVCVRVFGGGGGGPADAIEDVARAVRMIEGSAAFVRIMPEVSVNVAYAPEGATSAKQVVAVPGRIVRVGGTARAFMRPEYGASTHVANVLLAAMARDSSTRASMNVRYDPRMARALRSAKVPYLLLKPQVDGSDFLESLRASLARSSGHVRAVADPGGPGLEPGLYLFAPDAVAVAELGLKLAIAYSRIS